MKTFFSTQNQSKTGNLSVSRTVQWLIARIDENKIELDGSKGVVVVKFHTPGEVIIIPLDELLLFLKMRDEQLAELFINYKRIKYG